MDLDLWNREYEHITPPHLDPALTGFNVILDRIITVDRDLLESPVFSTGRLAELRTRLVHAMERCTAEEWIISDPNLYKAIASHFAGTGSFALGGQAGIAAVHLARLGAPDVVCLAPALGKEAAALLRGAGVHIPGEVTGQDAVHHILEYQQGLVPLAAGAIPRNNRFIISPKKSKKSTLIPNNSLAGILPRITSCTRAFLSGFQYLSGEAEFRAGADQIRAIRGVNRRMRVHIECVSVEDPEVNAGIVNHILPAADSTGMNEHEISLLLGHPAGLSPSGLVQEMLMLADLTGLSRVHLHTYGYYLLVIRDPAGGAPASRDALLYAAKVVARIAGGSTAGVTPAGIDALNQVRSAFGADEAPGIFPAGDYHVIVVPTLIARDIRRTVGLGDILSSTAFAADPF